jgi:hypothetical protein
MYQRFGERCCFQSLFFEKTSILTEEVDTQEGPHERVAVVPSLSQKLKPHGVIKQEEKPPPVLYAQTTDLVTVKKIDWFLH